MGRYDRTAKTFPCYFPGCKSAFTRQYSCNQHCQTKHRDVFFARPPSGAATRTATTKARHKDYPYTKSGARVAAATPPHRAASTFSDIELLETAPADTSRNRKSSTARNHHPFRYLSNPFKLPTGEKKSARENIAQARLGLQTASRKDGVVRRKKAALPAPDQQKTKTPTQLASPFQTPRKLKPNGITPPQTSDNDSETDTDDDMPILLSPLSARTDIGSSPREVEDLLCLPGQSTGRIAATLAAVTDLHGHRHTPSPNQSPIIIRATPPSSHEEASNPRSSTATASTARSPTWATRPPGLLHLVHTPKPSNKINRWLLSPDSDDELERELSRAVRPPTTPVPARPHSTQVDDSEVDELNSSDDEFPDIRCPAVRREDPILAIIAKAKSPVIPASGSKTYRDQGTQTAATTQQLETSTRFQDVIEAILPLTRMG